MPHRMYRIWRQENTEQKKALPFRNRQSGGTAEPFIYCRNMRGGNYAEIQKKSVGKNCRPDSGIIAFRVSLRNGTCNVILGVRVPVHGQHTVHQGTRSRNTGDFRLLRSLFLRKAPTETRSCRGSCLRNRNFRRSCRNFACFHG